MPAIGSGFNASSSRTALRAASTSPSCRRERDVRPPEARHVDLERDLQRAGVVALAVSIEEGGEPVPSGMMGIEAPGLLRQRATADFAVMAREELEKWWRPELVEQLIDGLRKAGLEIAGEQGTVPAKPAAKTGS
jgi:hypothetical protein